MEQRDADARAPVEEASLQDPALEEFQRRSEEDGENAAPRATVESIEGGELCVESVLSDRVGDVSVGEMEDRLGEVPHRTVDLDPLVNPSPRGASNMVFSFCGNKIQKGEQYGSNPTAERYYD